MFLYWNKRVIYVYGNIFKIFGIFVLRWDIVGGNVVFLNFILYRLLFVVLIKLFNKLEYLKYFISWEEERKVGKR